MRIFYLPVTAQRRLIFCQKSDAPLVRAKPRLDDRLATRLARVWDRFEQSDRRWKQVVTTWVDKLLDTVPFEENGLRSVPPRHTRKRQLKDKSHISEKEAIRSGQVRDLEPVPLVFPATAGLTFAEAQTNVGTAALQGLKTHRRQMLWCLAGLPLTLPLSINPLLPNIPGIYLTYRLWANYRAYKAAQNLEYLVRHRQFRGAPLPALDTAYAEYPLPMTALLAARISDIFDDKTLDRELQQAIRQTSKPTPQPVDKEQ